MADAIISVVVERVAANIEQIRKEVNSVRHIKKDVQSLFNNLNIIRNVLDDAESRRFKDKIINNWLSRLEHIAHELEDVLDEWDYATLKHKVKQESNDVVVAPLKRKVSSLLSSSFLSVKKFFVCHNIAKKMKNVRKELDELLKEKDQYNFVMSQPTDSSPESWRVQSTSLINLAEIHGRVIDRDILVSKLVSNADCEDELGPHVLSIVGVGGIGKTTLAQLVYNDSQVREYFELRIWICVSDPFDVAGIAKGIIETVKEGSSPNPSQLDMLLKHVIESISGKKFLLVLDDVWTEDSNKWERLKKSLKHGGACSKILVTARNEGVAKMMGATTEDIHHLGQLSNEDCWLLLRRMALPGRNEEEFEKFQDIGKRIANKCKGLPLAAKTLGSLLRSKNTLQGWENLLTNEIWQMEGIELELFPHLLLSYNALSPTLKRCFSYCAIFPKDEKINVESLIENWMALGYLGNNMGSGQDMELKGRECFNVLANHSLFQDFEKDNVDEQIRWCKMHDIIHDFAQFLRKNGRVKDRQAKTTCQFCNPLSVSRVKEYHSLFCQYDQITPNICGCLTSLRILGLRNFHSRSMPQEIGSLIHLRWLDLSYNKSATEDTRTICKLYTCNFFN